MSSSIREVNNKTLLLLVILFTGLPVRGTPECIFPENLVRIEESAFAGTELLSAAVLPESLEIIGDNAFYGCSNLKEITVPDSVYDIGENVFDGCGDAILIRCGDNSSMRNYAILHRLDWDANTSCRALILSESYTGTMKELSGPVNDGKAMSVCLQQFSGRPFAVRLCEDLSAAEMIAAISEAFADATSNDISLLYFSGHGMSDGSLLASDLETVTPSQIRQSLDAVEGRKIVIVDACYSGQLISRQGMHSTTSSITNETSSTFVTAFQAAFRTALQKKTRGVFNTDSYYVITAAQASEESEEGYITSGSNGCIMGYFTYGLCRGLGWDGIADCSTDLASDMNGDNAVSIQEAYIYAQNYAYGVNNNQTAAVWPSDCIWFAPFR